MSIRKREWESKKGAREAWVLDYVDQHGKRRLKTFARKKDAETYRDTIAPQVRSGTHVPDSASATVAEAGELWLTHLRAGSGLERTSIGQYEQHVRLHIVPFLGREKLSRLTVPRVRAFADQLAAAGRSETMVRIVVRTLGSLLADAQERGLVGHNAVRERTRAKRRTAADRHNGKLKVGTDIPTPEEIRALLAAAEGKWRVLLLVAVFTGLRASELRGLRWDDVDLTGGELHVRQRADRYNEIGSPKSRAGARTIPLPPHVTQALREWKLQCPKTSDGQLGLVFPDRHGGVLGMNTPANQGLIPAMLKAGVVTRVLDDNGVAKRDSQGRPVLQAKYPGMHALRHFFASWCINRKADGGLELPIKMVQELMGHSSIVMTSDRYGHLFPRSDDRTELARAAEVLLGA